MKPPRFFSLILVASVLASAALYAESVKEKATAAGKQYGTTATQAIGFYGATPVVQPTPAVTAATLAGTLTGTVDGTIVNVSAIALSTSNTYTDAAVNTAVNTAITATNVQLKELQTSLNAVIADNAALRTSLTNLGLIGP